MGAFLEVVPITLLVGVIYAVYRFVRMKRRGTPVSWGIESIRCLFVCYLTGLMNLVLVPSNFWSHIWFYVRNGYPAGEVLGWFSGGFNFVPALYKYLTGELELGGWVKTMLAGNILMYVPMGLFLPFVSQKNHPRRLLILAMIIPAGVEILQPIVGRSFDIDDLFCNFLGIVIGYLLVFSVKFFGKNTRRARE